MKIIIYRIKSMKISITSKHEIKWREKYILQLNSSWFSNVTQYNVSPLSLKKIETKTPQRKLFPVPFSSYPLAQQSTSTQNKQQRAPCRSIMKILQSRMLLSHELPSCQSTTKATNLLLISKKSHHAHMFTSATIIPCRENKKKPNFNQHSRPKTNIQCKQAKLRKRSPNLHTENQSPNNKAN